MASRYIKGVTKRVGQVLAPRPHHVCEDPHWSCQMTGTVNGGPPQPDAECDCGATEWNKKAGELRKELRALLSSWDES